MQNPNIKLIPRYSEMQAWKQEKEKEFQREFGFDFKIDIEPMNVTYCMDSIARIVADELHVTMSHILGSSRHTTFMEARHIAVYLCWKLLDLKKQPIADFFCRDHATIIHSIRFIEDKIDIKDERICDKVDRCRKQIEAQINN